MDIEIPPPSVCLPPSSVPSTIKSVPTDQCMRPRSIAPTTLTSSSHKSDHTTDARNGRNIRPRSRKSRNGCATCKKRRLKCDETKPVCMNCDRRSLECEGYKKDYKWRTFEDTIKQSQAGKARKFQKNNVQSSASNQYPSGITPTSSHSNAEFPWLTDLPSSSSPAPVATKPVQARDQDKLTELRIQHSPAVIASLPNRGTDLNTSDCSSSSPTSNRFPTVPQDNDRRSHSADLFHVGTLPQEVDTGRSSNRTESNSPHLTSLTADCDTDHPSGTRSCDDDGLNLESGSNRQSPFDLYEISGQRLEVPSAIVSQVSSTSSRSSLCTLLKAPHLDPTSPEMLMLRFDRHTCGILSIKDGPFENPWRTIILPLAQESQALFYAISAMAALHGASTLPQLRLTGMAHMTKSISKLLAEMHEMPLDHILATALALAIAEGWDDRRSTGIRHLKGAKTFLNKALLQSKGMPTGHSDQQATRLKFFLNTYVYLDVIARLTSSEEHNDIDLDDLVQTVNEPTDSGVCEIDPLMGCATTLFPLLAKVGSLIQKIRRTVTTSLNVVSEANELREQLLQWEPPDMDLFEEPEDPSSQIRHALQTAEAFRRATLLYLHQAVTELSSEPSYEQAKATLVMLAATPLTSRTMVAQTFPLFVASCEMISPDDREWVSRRWDAMMERLPVLNVLSCWEIVKEIWRRRDQWAQRQVHRVPRMSNQNLSYDLSVSLSMENPMAMVESANADVFLEDEDVMHEYADRAHPRGLIPNTLAFQAPRRPQVRLPRRHTDISLLSGEIEYTVRGRLHWLGVMSDWNWEVFI